MKVGTKKERVVHCSQPECRIIVGRIDELGGVTGSADPIMCTRCKRITPEREAAEALVSSQDARVQINTKNDRSGDVAYTPAPCPDCGWTETYWSRRDAVRAFVNHRAQERITQSDMFAGETFPGTLKPYSD